tara:strand:- start:285 stop:533 length:249 start_codon:yes stop_codon:yes gene_type:complete
MNDGRQFTDYLTSKYRNTLISHQNKVPQNSYITYLQNFGLENQKDIFEKNRIRCNQDFGNCYTNVNVQECDFDVCRSMLELA